jgi:uncharacterized protein
MPASDPCSKANNLVQNGAGCTSGHIVSGLSRLSPRSVIATATFFTTTTITANIVTPIPMTMACVCPSTNQTVPCYTPTYPPTTTLSSLATLTASALFLSLLPLHVCSKQAAQSLTSFTSGALFSLALLISGLGSPQKVLQFFSFLPSRIHHFDPSTALILVFGVLPSVVHNLRRGFDKPPALESKFSLPTKVGWRDWSWRFLLGNAVFGVCWGASGVCPGPALVRPVLQPAWGMIWIGAFWTGSVVQA